MRHPVTRRVTVGSGDGSDEVFAVWGAHDDTRTGQVAANPHGAGIHLRADPFQAETRFVEGHHCGDVRVAERFGVVDDSGSLGVAADGLAGDAEPLRERLHRLSGNVLGQQFGDLVRSQRGLTFLRISSDRAAKIGDFWLAGALQFAAQHP